MSGSDLFTGTLNILILRTLREEPLHGYLIGRRIRDTSRGALDVEEGALYPALHRLERRGFLSSEWGKTNTNRRAKFYSLTKAGTEHLEAESARWHDFSEAVQAVLG